MRKQLGKKEEQIFRNEYNKWLHSLCDELLEYRDNMVEVMKGTDLKTFDSHDDFKDTAKQAIFHKIDCFYRQQANIDEANSILNDLDDDNHEYQEV